MRKLTKLLAVCAVCTSMVMQVSAFTITQVKPEDILSDQVLESLNVSFWAEEEISQAKESGLTTQKTSFYLTSDITREAFAELVVNWVELVKGYEITPASTSTFTDTTDTSILKAYNAGIINGVGNDLFNPTANATRQDIAVMLYRAINLLKSENLIDIDLTQGDLTQYTDSANLGSWAVEAVSVLAQNGVMKGTSDTTLSPRNTCTIEQSIILVNRLYN